MKNFALFTYPQKGACNLFFRRYVMPKIHRPFLTITFIIALAIILIGVMAGIFWVGWLAAAIGIAVLLLLAGGILNTIFRIRQLSYEALFVRRVKYSQVWQEEYFLQSTIRFYERVKKEYPPILKELELTIIPKDLNIYEDFLVMPVKAENARNQCYRTMACAVLLLAKNQYDETVAYLAEKNKTLPVAS